jgi:hypothetical protein
MTTSKAAACVAAAVCLVFAGWLAAQEGPSPDLDKPLQQFTIGDLFPPVAGPIARQTGEMWTEAGTDLQRRIEGRRRSIDEVLPDLKKRISALKAEVKAARRSKDFTATGAAEGKLATEEAVAGILRRLTRVTEAQRDVGRAWHEAGEALLAFASAEEAFDAYRSAGIAKPHDDPNHPDTRLDAPGVTAFRRHAEAMDEMGSSFTALGGEIRALVDDRLKFLAELERAGHIRTPPLK